MRNGAGPVNDIANEVAFKHGIITDVPFIVFCLAGSLLQTQMITCPCAIKVVLHSAKCRREKW